VEAIRFYTDEHVPRAVVGGLRQRGIDVLSVAEANMLGADDEALLAFALAEGRVILPTSCALRPRAERTRVSFMRRNAPGRARSSVG
jgi:uncharacterized protein with PIN domain